MKTRFHFIALAAACATAAAITPVAHAAIRFIDTNTTLGVDTADIWIGTATPTTACTVTASAATNITGNINVFNLSTFNMSAGRVTGIYANNSSRVTLSGGTLGGQIQSIDSSVFTMSGGSVGTDASAFNTSTLEITGGSIARNLFAVDSSTVNLRGGSIGSITYLRNSATLNIYGSNLSITSLTNPQPGRTVYILAGTLANGTNITGMTIWQDTFGGATNSLHLHNIPTPGATASLALAGLTTIKRKRPSARST